MTRSALPGLLLPLALAAGSACSRPAPEADLPEGAFLAGRTPALIRLLEGLEGLEGTPAARRSREIRERLAGCDEFAGAAPDGDLEALLEDLACRPFASLPAGLESLRGDGDVAVLLPLGAAGRLAAGARVSPAGDLVLDGRVERDGASRGGLGALLAPAAEPAGSPSLSARDALLHLRFRAEGGLDLASLVPADSQGDRLFRLKSELFSGAVLEGTWEVAVYLPAEGQPTPPMALAVDVRLESAAVAAMEKFLDDLEATWPVHRTAVELAGHPGACLFDLRVLPDFAPCYVAAGRTLVVGFNPASVERALAADGPEAGEAPADVTRSALGGASGMVVHLSRFAEADRILRRTHAPESPPLGFDYTWDRLVARATGEPGGVRLRLALQSKGPS